MVEDALHSVILAELEGPLLMVNGMIQHQERHACAALGVCGEHVSVAAGSLTQAEQKTCAVASKVQDMSKGRGRPAKRARKIQDQDVSGTSFVQPTITAHDARGARAPSVDGKIAGAAGSRRGERETPEKRSNGFIELGNGVRLPIPPFYDDLVGSGRLPALKDIAIDEDVLKGPITTITLADLKAATQERQAAKPWACFPSCGLGHRANAAKPLSQFLDMDASSESTQPADVAAGAAAERHPHRTDRSSKKRGRPSKDEAGSDNKRRAVAGRKAAPTVKPHILGSPSPELCAIGCDKPLAHLYIGAGWVRCHGIFELLVM